MAEELVRFHINGDKNDNTFINVIEVPRSVCGLLINGNPTRWKRTSTGFGPYSALKYAWKCCRKYPQKLDYLLNNLSFNNLDVTEYIIPSFVLEDSKSSIEEINDSINKLIAYGKKENKMYHIKYSFINLFFNKEVSRELFDQWFCYHILTHGKKNRKTFITHIHKYLTNMFDSNSEQYIQIEDYFKHVAEVLLLGLDEEYVNSTTTTNTETVFDSFEEEINNAIEDNI